MHIRYIVVMGVSGCGKSTIAERVAQQLHWLFLEGDALHPPANVEKMRQGIPLDDADRAPWLEAVAQTIRHWRSQGRCAVIACSALRRAYRDIIVEGHDDLCFVYLHGTHELLVQRLQNRRSHFMPLDLLDSQLALLEEPEAPPERAIRLEIDKSPEVLAHEVFRSVSGYIAR
ncbi:gluconokinase [Oleiagrimonas sp.]|jgi:gluconokinase|uniref:gluconokinase n=1 Tax=Oleiagrimonas sp. TaxID=2010330 RepID=UPI0031BB66F6